MLPLRVIFKIKNFFIFFVLSLPLFEVTARINNNSRKFYLYKSEGYQQIIVKGSAHVKPPKHQGSMQICFQVIIPHRLPDPSGVI